MNRCTVRAGLIGRQDMLRQQFQAWLLDVGTTLVKDTEKEASLIESLLQLRAKMNTILAEPFCRENSFAKVCWCHCFVFGHCFWCNLVSQSRSLYYRPLWCAFWSPDSLPGRTGPNLILWCSKTLMNLTLLIVTLLMNLERLNTLKNITLLTLPGPCCRPSETRLRSL